MRCPFEKLKVHFLGEPVARPSFPRPLQQRTPRQSFIVISRGNDIVFEVLIPFASFNWDVRGLCCTLSSMIKLAF